MKEELVCGKWKKKKGISSHKEKVQPFTEILPQQQPKDNHVSGTDREALWFIEYIPIPLSTQHNQYFKGDAACSSTVGVWHRGQGEA